MSLLVAPLVSPTVSPTKQVYIPLICLAKHNCFLDPGRVITLHRSHSRRMEGRMAGCSPLLHQRPEFTSFVSVLLSLLSPRKRLAKVEERLRLLSNWKKSNSCASCAYIFQYLRTRPSSNLPTVTKSFKLT